MQPVIAFDIYGTLIDTHGVTTLLEKVVGEDAMLFSVKWREKQLEYTFRRGLMKNYQPFSACTAASLEFTCNAMGVVLSNEDKRRLLDQYSNLPCFSDVIDGLSALKEKYHLVAFSNGEASAVKKLLVSAGIDDFFKDVVSADEINTFKPNPDIYHHLLARTSATPQQTYLVSSNPFDVIGASAVSINAVWVKRQEKMAFDPWEYQPSIVVNTLSELPPLLP